MDINKPINIKIDGRKFDQADTVQNIKRRISHKKLQNQDLSPDEQAERVNLLLIGLASLILMNAMAVLIILFVKLSKYENQLVMNSNLIEEQTKGMRTAIYFHFLIVFIFLLVSPKLITILVKNRKSEKQESTKYCRKRI